MTIWDVAVVGAGNAALCAAIAARLSGADVVVLERAPREKRGGNSWFTDGAIRFAYSDLADVRGLIPAMDDREAGRIDLPPYPPSAFSQDLIDMSDGRADPALVELMATESLSTMRWLTRQGVDFGMIYDNQAFEYDGKHHFWGGLVVKALGRGIGLMDALFSRCAELRIPARYDHRVTALDRAEGGFALSIDGPAGPTSLKARRVILACGGFESSPALRARHLGAAWAEAAVRGTEFNTGDGLELATSAGGTPWGAWDRCHAIATDWAAPPFGDRSLPGDVYKKHSYPLGLVVNRDGARFVDEGADYRNYTYARYGADVLGQPGGAGFQVFDRKVAHLLRDEYRRPEATVFEAETVEDVAAAAGIAPEGLARTIRDFNAAVGDAAFNPHVKDGRSTAGIEPPKSNWANRIDEPPFLVYPVRCAITFTFGGVRVDDRGRVLDEAGTTISGLYAAGEMVGGLFHGNYPGGAGLMSGATLGRLAGTHAAQG